MNALSLSAVDAVGIRWHQLSLQWRSLVVHCPTLSYHVLPCPTMSYRVLPCPTMLKQKGWASLGTHWESMPNLRRRRKFGSVSPVGSRRVRSVATKLYRRGTSNHRPFRRELFRWNRFCSLKNEHLSTFPPFEGTRNSKHKAILMHCSTGVFLSFFDY